MTTHLEHQQEEARQIMLARAIATVAHHGQFRRDGITPYIKQPMAVAESVNPLARPAAWLHDVLEDDTGVTTEGLAEFGIWQSTIDAVVLLTKKPGAVYLDYIRAIKGNPVARAVKIADIKHNLNGAPSPHKILLYKEGLAILEGNG